MKTILLICPLILLFISGCSEREFGEVDDIEKQEELPVDDTYQPLPSEFP